MQFFIDFSSNFHNTRLYSSIYVQINKRKKKSSFVNSFAVMKKTICKQTNFIRKNVERFYIFIEFCSSEIDLVSVSLCFLDMFILSMIKSMCPSLKKIKNRDIPIITKNTLFSSFFYCFQCCLHMIIN